MRTMLAARVRAPFEGLFDWWMQELREAWDAIERRHGEWRSPRFRLQVSAEHAELTRIGDPAGERRTFKLLDGQLPALDEVWPGERPRNARIELVLADADVLVFQLHVPPLQGHELNDAVELQLERKLPLSREHLYVDWEVTRREADRSRTVSVAAVRRERAERWRERLRGWPWRLERVACRDLDSEIRFNLRSRVIERVSFAFGRREARLAWIAAGLAVALSVTTASQWIYERISLADSIEEARLQVTKARELRAALERESAPLILVRKLTDASAAGTALVALSGTLPSDAWIYQADIRALASSAPVITMEGYTPSAATLVKSLEETRQFAGIQLVETSAADAGVNRIKLKAQLQSSAAP